MPRPPAGPESAGRSALICAVRARCAFRSLCSARARDTAEGTSTAQATIANATPTHPAAADHRTGRRISHPTPTAASTATTPPASNMYRGTAGQPCSANAISTTTQSTIPADSSRTTRWRRHAAHVTASSART